MSDNADGAPDAKDKDDKAKAGKARTPVVVLAMLLLNLGATGFGVFTLVQMPHADAAKVEAPVSPTAEVTGPVVALEPFVVNLDEPGNPRYLKVTLQLEVADPKAAESFEKSKQVARDVVLRHLSGLTLKDTLGAQAKDTLRDGLMKDLGDVLGPGRIRRMFFQEFVVQ